MPKPKKNKKRKKIIKEYPRTLGYGSPDYPGSDRTR